MTRPAMMKRSGKVWAQSGPTAWACNFCSQIVHALASAEITANGAIANGSRQRIFSRIHEMQSARTKGSITTEGLLNAARMKKTSDKANNINERRSPLALAKAAVRRRAASPCFSHFKKKKIESR